MKTKNIIFTGGGSGGHLMPAISLIERLKSNQLITISYIGGRDSIEREVISRKGIRYHPIFTGKLRRYISLENFVDIFKVFFGVIQSVIILLKYKASETIVFSTGGFVSVPVVVGGWITGKTIYIHEQTTRVGLANKICSKFAKKVFVSFDESIPFFPAGKSILSGNPLRDEVYSDVVNDVVINGFSLKNSSKPILFVTGGGNGALILNELVRLNLKELKEKYTIIHQVGKKFISIYEKLNDNDYLATEFANSIIDIFKLSKVVISRAGAGTVCELMALNKRSIFVPLEIAQKNEQYHNAMAAKKRLGSIVIREDDLPDINIIEVIESLGAHDSSALDKVEVKPADIILKTLLLS